MNHIRYSMGLTGDCGLHGGLRDNRRLLPLLWPPTAAAAKAAGDGKKIKTELETDRQIRGEREREIGTGKNLITSPTAM